MVVEAETTDNKYSKFKIKQSHCAHGDSRYRKQTINVAFYDAEGGLRERIERVNIERNETTEIEKCKDKQVPAAVLLNSEDWGFGHFHLDDAALKVFEGKLSKVQSALDRNVVLGQIICMMRQIEYPATKLTTIMNQLQDEKNQNLINALHAACAQAVALYLPTEAIPTFKKEVADFFLKKAKKDASNKDLQVFCIDKAVEFIAEQANLKMAADWINNGKITVDGDALNCELTNQ